MAENNTYNHNIETIGTGAIFPIKLSKNKQGLMGWYPVQGDLRLIENNLQALIEYSLGQRLREESFGTRLWECIEEPNTQALNFMVREFLNQAIAQYEPRIRIQRVTLIRKDTKLNIVMEYYILGTNTQSFMELIFNQ